ncbi:MAG: glycosyltransferase family 4 protein [Candidatus Bathyarchaeia archaeon]
MLRVLVAGAVLDPVWRGGEPLIAKLVVEGLKELGIEVFTYGEVRKRDEVCLDTVYPYDINFIRYNRYLELLKHLKPDVVLGFYDYDCSLCLASLKLKVPYIACVHIYWPVCPLLTLYVDGQGVCNGPSFFKCLKHLSFHAKNNIVTALKRLSLGSFICIKSLSRRIILSKASAIVVPSFFMKNKLASFGFKNIHVIYNGIDLNEINYNEWSGGKKVIVNPTGYVEERKGFYHFLTIARMLKKCLGQEVKFLCVNYRGDEYVEGTDYLSRSQLIKIYEEAYLVVVLPLWEEPFGLTVVEAMAAGKPVVAYESGGISEIIVNGVTGLLVPKGDVKSLTSAVRYLIENEDIAKKMGREGRKRVERSSILRVWYKNILIC